MSAWPIVEAVIHRWIRESTGIAADKVYWPSRGLPEPEPPSAWLSVISDRDFTRSGHAEKRTAQNVEWLVTVDAGPGTHTIELFVVDQADPVATASVTMPGGTSVVDATAALLADATAEFSDITVAASGTDAIRLTGTATLPRFHAVTSSTLTPEVAAGPQQVLRVTAEEVVISIEFRSEVSSGDGTARLLAQQAKDGMRDFDSAMSRAGRRFGAILRDTPSYLEDLTESRHVLDVQLLGHRVSVRGPKPWVRTVRSTLTAGGNSTTVSNTE